jgi:hypothetical protein
MMHRKDIWMVFGAVLGSAVMFSVAKATGVGAQDMPWWWLSVPACCATALFLAGIDTRKPW